MAQRKQHELWNERDEIQRLDFVAGVVAPTSLAGCVACAALIATGNLVSKATYALGLAGAILIGCVVVSTLSLLWSPLQAVERGEDLKDLIRTKRSRTYRALIALVGSILLGFGGATFIQLDHNGDNQTAHERDPHSKSPGAHHQQAHSGANWFGDQSANQDADQHHRDHESHPVAVNLRDEIVHASSKLDHAASVSGFLPSVVAPVAEQGRMAEFADDTEDDWCLQSGKSALRATWRHAGGGTRTPDTRIMIPLL
jgi:hypothetical protein